MVTGLEGVAHRYKRGSGQEGGGHQPGGRADHRAQRGNTNILHSGNLTFITINIRGAAAASPDIDNKLRQLIAKRGPLWHSSCVILLQEVQLGTFSGINPQSFGASSRFSQCGGLGLLTGGDWRICTVRPASLCRPRAYFEEYRLAHVSGARWSVFNVHLPSPTHAHRDLCAKLLAELLPRVRRSFHRADATLVGGDFNESLTHNHTSGTFHTPLVLPALMHLGLSNLSGDAHTYFRAGHTHSAKLDWILASLPVTTLSLRHSVQPLVDSDHKSCILTCKVDTRRPFASLPIPDRPRWPGRWACTGLYDRANGVVCLSGPCKGSTPSRCQLGHGCVHEIDLREKGISEVGILEMVQSAQVRILSGVSRALARVRWETVHTWEDALSRLKSTLEAHVVRRLTAPKVPKPSRVSNRMSNLAALVRRCVRRPRAWARPPATIRHLVVGEGRGEDLLNEARAAMKREVRRLRRGRIQLALRERRVQLEKDLRAWHSRIKIRSPPLRTDAHWRGRTLNFEPKRTRKHFAAAVKATGTNVPGPAHHPFADQLPVLPKKKRRALGVPFTVAELEAVLKRARASSAPGPSGITIRMIRMIPVVHVTRWCNAALQEGSLGRLASCAYVRLLNKTDVEFPPPGKFRPITLLETSYKLVSALIQARVLTALRREQVVPATAYAFGVRTDISAPILHRAALLDHAICTGAPLIIIDFDASAAFNSPTHQTILDAWDRMGAPTNVRTLLASMLSAVRIRVITDVGLSAGFTVERGAVQGDVLAPLHWLLTYAALQHHWAATAIDFGLSSDGGTLKLRFIVYADDTAVYLREHTKVAQLANMVAESLRAIGVQVNALKTVIQALNTPPEFTSVVIQDTTVEVTSGSLVRYLGVFRSTSDPSDTVGQALGAVRQISHRFRTGAMTVAEAVRLVSSVAIPQMAYRLALTPAGTDEINQVQMALHAIIRTAKGFPIGVPESQSRMVLPSLLQRVHATRLEVIRRHLCDDYDGSIQDTLNAGLMAAMPDTLRTPADLRTWLQHPKLACCAAAQGTLLAAILESMTFFRAYLGDYG
ncbi:MAG: reverse transcriptase domain-containing protein [Dehalococcoidia bacterium]|nr:reverse transcriptase domain-containing protein [Dehalococcoidia bacterium]